MPATFSRRRLEWLLLLLCISLSGGSPTDPVMTTQDASQSQVNPLTKVQARLNESSGPDPTTQDLKQPSKETMSNGSFVQSEILLPGASGTPLERIITLANATTVELSCKLDTNSHLKSPQVTWKRGNETISHTSKTESSWSIRLAVVDNSKMGSYSCILKGEEEISGVFHLQVPKIEARGKFVISYERDAAVLLCKSGATPMAWTWYMISGSKQIVINASLQADKYLIDRVSANVTHLRILKITKEDAGVYCCEATFELGKATLEIELKVLSIMAPLKPFLAVVAEVVILLTTIILYEVYSKRKEKCTVLIKENMSNKPEVDLRF
ncbi:embigin isoform X2 [Pithys albifrons albifrons]|uniref:embigin isoform X2 n=1 Tax=Pithys albifrons albifrons TaxID=3385563 RepID=UPI003A5CFF91